MNGTYYYTCKVPYKKLDSKYSCFVSGMISVRTRRPQRFLAVLLSPARNMLGYYLK